MESDAVGVLLVKLLAMTEVVVESDAVGGEIMVTAVPEAQLTTLPNSASVWHFFVFGLSSLPHQ